MVLGICLHTVKSNVYSNVLAHYFKSLLIPHSVNTGSVKLKTCWQKSSVIHLRLNLINSKT